MTNNPSFIHICWFEPLRLIKLEYLFIIIGRKETFKLLFVILVIVDVLLHLLSIRSWLPSIIALPIALRMFLSIFLNCLNWIIKRISLDVNVTLITHSFDFQTTACLRSVFRTSISIFDWQIKDWIFSDWSFDKESFLRGLATETSSLLLHIDDYLRIARQGTTAD